MGRVRKGIIHKDQAKIVAKQIGLDLWIINLIYLCKIYRFFRINASRRADIYQHLLKTETVEAEFF